MSTVLAKIETVYLSREAREAIADPHKRHLYYSRPRHYYKPKPRCGALQGVDCGTAVVLAGIAGIGLGLIKAGLLSSQNGK